MARPIPALFEKILSNVVIVKSPDGREWAVPRCEYHGPADHSKADVDFRPKVEGCEECAAIMWWIKDVAQRERRAAEGKPDQDWEQTLRAVSNMAQQADDGVLDFRAYRRPQITVSEDDVEDKSLIILPN